VAVIAVEPESPAWKAGLRPGDFVSHVGAARVTTPREFYNAVHSIESDAVLTLTATQPAGVTRTVGAGQP
jgi:S1-C subfamily serine protease